MRFNQEVCQLSSTNNELNSGVQIPKNCLIIDQIDAKVTDFRAIVATWLATAILYAERCLIDHDDDPPWDCSGKVCIDEGSFILSDYQKLSDFLEELTGNTEASYESGCGFFHTTYEKALQYIVWNYIHQVFQSQFQDYDNWSNDVEDASCEFSTYLMEVSCEWSCVELFEEGLTTARLQHAQSQLNKNSVVENQA